MVDLAGEWIPTGHSVGAVATGSGMFDDGLGQCRRLVGPDARASLPQYCCVSQGVSAVNTSVGVAAWTSSVTFPVNGFQLKAAV
jgi:hypothetical protein